MKKVLVILIALVILGIAFWKWFFNQPYTPPDKPNSVPVEAIWKGGCDGGTWIELIKMNRNKVRFRVYRDWSGELILDADFEYLDCNEFRLSKSTWNEYVSSYLNGNIGIMEKSNAGLKCRLEPIEPPYFYERID